MEDLLFWKKVNKTAGCWLWTGGTSSPVPYGRVKRLGRMYQATHWSVLLSTGSLPAAGMVVLHSCDNPICVNPSHLSVGTQKENIKDCNDKGRDTRHMPALTPGTVRKIRELRSAGMTYADIGERFGITLQSVFDYCKGKHAGYG